MFLTSEFQIALYIEGKQTWRAITSPTETIDVIAQVKAASVLRMLKHFVTEEMFKLSLRDYLASNKYLYYNSYNIHFFRFYLNLIFSHKNNVNKCLFYFIKIIFQYFRKLKNLFEFQYS